MQNDPIYTGRPTADPVRDGLHIGGYVRVQRAPHYLCTDTVTGRSAYMNTCLPGTGTIRFVPNLPAYLCLIRPSHAPPGAECGHTGASAEVSPAWLGDWGIEPWIPGLM
jgi:hypothetical protein